MAAFSYKTRGNSSPQGKAKVYFACHPDDFSLFDAISNEILAEVNCAVFYKTDPIENEAEHLSLLAEMNLIVIPITTKFLTVSSPARDIEFPFSQKKHIPVLPLMQESGLVDIFNAVCGDIQFLDPNARDDTAISYEEKFKTFLNSILIGDKLAEEIRQAFDAYIFLSYRKKDRKYAQELMRLIHENDFCRDVAIWYDEFLTPGENFNDMIAAALDKSKLFALAVTPNLVNETNYIMTTEYPMAKDAGKTILPVEMSPTDKRALAENYKDIPENIKASDPKHLADALINALDNVVLRDNDTDPRHNFFIGLAYLSGIDVEKNPDRALSLITSAAEADLPEAIEKLVTIYKKGEGVKRDHTKAIHWQEKLAEFYRKQFETANTEENALLYITALLTLGDFYLDSFHNHPARSAYQTALDTLIVIFQTNTSNQILSYQARCHDSLGQVEKSVENLNAAIQHYQKSLDIRKKIAETENSIQNQYDIWNSYIHFGDFYVSGDQLTTAHDEYKKALTLITSIHEAAPSQESEYHLALTHIRLGDLIFHNENEYFTIPRDCLPDQNPIEANWMFTTEHYKQAFLLLNRLKDQTHDPIIETLILKIYGKSADLLLQYDSINFASEALEEAHPRTLRLFQENETFETRLLLIESYQRTGLCAQKQGDYSFARVCYEEAVELAKWFDKKLPTVNYTHIIARCHDSLGDLFFQKNEFPSACQEYLKALTIREAWVRETCSYDSRKTLKKSYKRLEQLSMKYGDYLLAFGFTVQTTKIILVGGELRAAWADLMNQKREFAHFERTGSFPDKPIIFSDLYPEHDDRSCLEALARHRYLLPKLQAAEAKYLGDIDTALRLYIDACRAHQAFLDEYHIEDAEQDLFFDYCEIEKLALDYKHFAIAFTYCQKELEAQKQIIKKTKTDENLKTLTEIYTKLLELAPETNTSPTPIAEDFILFTQQYYSETQSSYALDRVIDAATRLSTVYREKKEPLFKRIKLALKLRRYRRLKKRQPQNPT